VLDDAALTGWIDRAFDLLCEKRVSDLIDVDTLIAGADAVGAPERVSWIVTTFVAPVRERLLAAARASDRLIGEWVPAPAKDALATLLGAPMKIPDDLIDELVTSEEVRDSVRSMLQESFLGIIAKARRTPLAGAAMLFGGVFDLFQERIGQLMDVGVGIVQQRIAQKLADPATAKALGKRRRRGFLRLLKRPERDAATWIDRIPNAAIDALTPSLVAHNLAREEVRAGLRAEIDRVLRELSREPIGALLDRLGLRELARTTMRARALPLLRELLASP
jgi:hypothetical protein